MQRRDRQNAQATPAASRNNSIETSTDRRKATTSVLTSQPQRYVFRPPGATFSDRRLQTRCITTSLRYQGTKQHRLSQRSSCKLAGIHKSKLQHTSEPECHSISCLRTPRNNIADRKQMVLTKYRLCHQPIRKKLLVYSTGLRL